MNDNIISKRFKEALQTKGIKQAEVVEKTGIPKSSISSYLSGRYVPKQTNLYKIAKVLDVNVLWLMGYDVPMDADSSNTNVEQYAEHIQKYSDRFFEKLLSDLSPAELEKVTEYIEFIKSKND